jgi:hypothetical protein
MTVPTPASDAPAPPRETALIEAEGHLGEAETGPKAGRPDYAGFLSLADAVALRDELARLRTHLRRTEGRSMGRLEDLPAESRAELEEFAAHLREHRPVAQLDCRYCLLRLSCRPASPAQEATPPRCTVCGCSVEDSRHADPLHHDYHRAAPTPEATAPEPDAANASNALRWLCQVTGDFERINTVRGYIAHLERAVRRQDVTGRDATGKPLAGDAACPSPPSSSPPP